MIAVAFLMGFNVFARLGGGRVDDSDEARYGVASYEMLRGGSWIVPTYGGVPETWNLKPPLGYWIQAGSFALFGPTLFALRLPSALSALATLLLVMALACRWLGRTEAVLAGLVLATAYGFLGHHAARSGDLDGMLTLLVILAMAQVPELGERLGRHLLLGCTFGAIFLLKSFAVIAPIATVVCLLMLTREREVLRRLPAALAVTAVVAGGWALARVHADGSTSFIRQMVREDLFERTTRPIDKEATVSWTHLDNLADRFAPWPLALLGAIAVSGRKKRTRPTPRFFRFVRSREGLLLLCWAGVPLVLFSVARTQHHWYLVPVYPALAMLTAVALRQLGASAGTSLRRRALVVAVALSVVGCELRVLEGIFVRDQRPEWQAFLVSLPASWPAGPASVRALFPLYHSERFLLEVVDGYQVVEPGYRPPGMRSDPRALRLAARPPRLAEARVKIARRPLLSGENYVLYGPPRPFRGAVVAARSGGGVSRASEARQDFLGLRRASFAPSVPAVDGRFVVRQPRDSPTNRYPTPASVRR